MRGIAPKGVTRAAFTVGTNLLDTDAWPDEAVLALYGEQRVVERGFAFLKGPLFLASSVFVKRPQRIMALAFEHDALRAGLEVGRGAPASAPRPDGMDGPRPEGTPTALPTLHWLFQ